MKKALVFFIVLSACLNPSGESTKEDTTVSPPETVPERTVPPPPESETDFYSSRIKPMLQETCSHGSCHRSAETINLTAFPFDPTGSYTMDRIVAEVGEDAYALKAQKIIVEELILSMEELYMPPAREAKPEEIAVLKEWLAMGLPPLDDGGREELLLSK